MCSRRGAQPSAFHPALPPPLPDLGLSEKPGQSKGLPRRRAPAVPPSSCLDTALGRSLACGRHIRAFVSLGLWCCCPPPCESQVLSLARPPGRGWWIRRCDLRCAGLVTALCLACDVSAAPGQLAAFNHLEFAVFEPQAFILRLNKTHRFRTRGCNWKGFGTGSGNTVTPYPLGSCESTPCNPVISTTFPTQ